MWQGLQSTTDYKGRPSRDLPNDAALPDELIAFYARFNNNNTVPCVSAPTDPEDWGVTKKTFWSDNFRSALENGVWLCDLINRIKPGIIKRVDRLSTPIAGLDNVIVFLRLKEAQLFRPGDLQDTSTRVDVKC
ncbi:LIM and calponin homology domains-containing protein 1-like [Salvelinus alpinus]